MPFPHPPWLPATIPLPASSHRPATLRPTLPPFRGPAVSTLVKKAVKQPRPAATCALLGNCHKHGMPSSHSAVMAFAATTALLVYLHRRRSRSGAGSIAHMAAGGAGTSGRRDAGGGSVAQLSRAVELVQVLLLALLAAAVAYGRVYLGYHSAAQVAAGLALGSCLAAAWWALTLAACQRWAGGLLLLPLLRALHFRNTLGCADVHAREAALFGAGAAATAKRAD